MSVSSLLSAMSGETEPSRADGEPEAKRPRTEKDIDALRKMLIQGVVRILSIRVKAGKLSPLPVKDLPQEFQSQWKAPFDLHQVGEIDEIAFLQQWPSKVELTMENAEYFVQLAKKNEAADDKQLYTVRLDRSSNKRLGIDIDVNPKSVNWDGKTLLIKNVLNEGLVAEWNHWNAAEPTKVCSGHRIVEANGCKGDAKVLIGECQKQAALILSIMPEEEPELPDPREAEVLRWLRGEAALEPTPEVRRISDHMLERIKMDVSNTKTATNVVKVVRKNLEHFFDVRWGGEALYRIARRSTAKTRREWAADSVVQSLAAQIRDCDGRGPGDLDAKLQGMEAIQRMELQDVEDQCRGLEILMSSLEAERWKSVLVTSLVRVLWLIRLVDAPSLWKQVLHQLRRRGGEELDGEGAALMTLALGTRMKRRKAESVPLSEDDMVAFDSETDLILRFEGRLTTDGAFAHHFPGDLLELGEGLLALQVRDVKSQSRILKALGRGILRRAGEYDKMEMEQVKLMFDEGGEPLDDVFGVEGTVLKGPRSAVTVQTFKANRVGLQKKKDREDDDVERVSPARVECNMHRAGVQRKGIK